MINLLRRSLFIRAIDTPNPNFMKFMPGEIVLEEGTLDFAAPRYTNISPMARKLFEIDGVERVFYGRDYVSVGKTEEEEWDVLKPLVYEVMMDQFTGAEPLVLEEAPAGTEINEDDSEVVQLIKEILNVRIRPSIQEDGGDVGFISFEDGVLMLQM